MMSTYLYIVLFLIGGALGSFFYTLALRLVDPAYAGHPVRLLSGRSHCVNCGSRIRAIYLIPFVGYFLTRARCPDCRTRIHPAYPLAEFIAGALLVAVIYDRGLSLVSLSEYFVLISVLAIAVADLKTMIIPYPLVVLVVLFSIWPLIVMNDWRSPLYGVLLMGGLFLAILLIFPGGFGGGDLKLAAATGLFLGIDLSIVALEVALVVGAVTGVIYAIATRKGLRIRIPFAPFIAIGLIAAYFYGRKILLVYYGMF
jgi:prepilin signal peptidase PulO-like enzyme (type II secretory pathway)